MSYEAERVERDRRIKQAVVDVEVAQDAINAADEVLNTARRDHDQAVSEAHESIAAAVWRLRAEDVIRAQIVELAGLTSTHVRRILAKPDGRP